jgi:hypothetical protein
MQQHLHCCRDTIAACFTRWLATYSAKPGFKCRGLASLCEPLDLSSSELLLLESLSMLSSDGIVTDALTENPVRHDNSRSTSPQKSNFCPSFLRSIRPFTSILSQPSCFNYREKSGLKPEEIAPAWVLCADHKSSQHSTRRIASSTWRSHL